MEPFFASPASYLIVAFAAFFCAYALGRRRGKREGFNEGVRYSPLEMRRQTWERGHCVICGAEALPSKERRRENDQESLQENQRENEQESQQEREA